MRYMPSPFVILVRHKMGLLIDRNPRSPHALARTRLATIQSLSWQEIPLERTLGLYDAVMCCHTIISDERTIENHRSKRVDQTLLPIARKCVNSGQYMTS